MILKALLIISILIIILLILVLVCYFIQRDRIQDLSREAQNKISEETLEYIGKISEIQFKKESSNDYK
jgi:uncharacterized membrane protein